MFIEEKIIGEVKALLLGVVNDYLADLQVTVPFLEFDGFPGSPAVAGVCVPVIALSTCERSEKERIVRLDAYSLTIAFALPESDDAERYCYACAAAVDRALGEDPALGGVASRAVLTGKKYIPPKHAGTGEGWGLVLYLRLTVEGMGNVG
jgi:hypothetical protein